MNLVKLDSLQTMSSLSLLAMINEQRAKAGESTIRNADFLEKVVDELDLGGCSFSVTPHPQNNCPQYYLNLTIEQCTLVGMRESKGVRRSVLEKLKELEVKDRTIPIVLPTFPELLRQHADALDQLALAAPKVEFVDKFVSASTGSMGFREVCKLLSINEATFRKFLESEKIIYKLNGGKTPYANHLDAGRFETKAGINSKTGHAFNAYRFTTKGVEWVAGEFAKWQLRSKA